MRRSTLACGVLALFLASLVLAAVAEARVGGGRSSGSRGSRSFSAPRSPSMPSSPASPAAPTAPQRGFASPASPPRPGGPFGGFGGMLGGFLLGGLLGSLLFGGLGHGFGIGFLDILLVAGLAMLAFSLFRRREPVPAYAGAPGRAGWAPAAPSPSDAAPAPAPAATAAAVLDADLEQGVAAIQMMDPGFSPPAFAEGARDTFLRVQAAWSARDLGPVRGLIADELAAGLESDLGRLRTLRRVNRLEQVRVEAAEVTEAWQEYGQDFVTVRLRASLLDFTIDETTGSVVDGSRTDPSAFEEYWTFTRPVGPNPWRLTAIQQPA
jgi:predicted lipid-binding transport protein (Tim44 family)